jgi:hypothetical protein
MKRQLKFLIPISSVLFCFAGYQMYLDHTRAYHFEAEGTVTTAMWNTRNHAMSLFIIRSADGHESKLHHHRVILTEGQIKVGDSFSKERNSYNCSINGEVIRCVK